MKFKIDTEFAEQGTLLVDVNGVTVVITTENGQVKARICDAATGLPLSTASAPAVLMH